MYKIELEDLAANAFIKLMKNGKDTSFISYNDIERYGKNVIKVLESDNEVGILNLSRDKTSRVFELYSEYFEETKENGIRGLKLKCNSYESLVNKFIGYLPLKLLLAYNLAHW